jgi:hypothetical protein
MYTIIREESDEEKETAGYMDYIVALARGNVRTQIMNGGPLHPSIQGDGCAGDVSRPSV